MLLIFVKFSIACGSTCTQAHFWDLSAIHALDRVVLKFRREGTEVELFGMNEASKTLVLQLGTHDKPDAANEAVH